MSSEVSSSVSVCSEKQDYKQLPNPSNIRREIHGKSGGVVKKKLSQSAKKRKNANKNNLNELFQ